MKRQDALQKIDEMINEQDGVVEYLKKECERLLSCGAVDLDEYGNDYRLPKIILMIALENCSYQYSPLSHDKNLIRELKNLRNF